MISRQSVCIQNVQKSLNDWGVPYQAGRLSDTLVVLGNLWCREGSVAVGTAFERSDDTAW